MNSLFKEFDNVLIFDVETTGIDSKKDEIIEIAMLRIVNKKGIPMIESEFDALVNLTSGKRVPSVITNLTGITEQQILEEGISKNNVCVKVTDMLRCNNPLLAAYNAQFDLCFLYYFLNRLNVAGELKGIKMIDALTIYKDRKPYPHKLSDAANMYSLNTSSTHRARDDAKMTFELLCKMGKESDDLDRYVNLFGYNPKYGVSGSKISSVKYLPQGYDSAKKLYEF